jgi:hypothetical protein
VLLSLSEYQNRKLTNGGQVSVDMNDDLFKLDLNGNEHNRNNKWNQTNGGRGGAKQQTWHQMSNRGGSFSFQQNSLDSVPEHLIASPSMGGDSDELSQSTSSSNTSRARLAQKNLQRLEKEKDELFEL